MSLGWPLRAAEVSGAAIYHYCTGCHGPRGAGGEAGRYPRIAGLPAAYLDRQIHAFKAGERLNKPMIPVFKHARFDEDIIDLVSAHIAAMTIPDLGLWPYAPDPQALAAFESRADYVAAGQSAYADQCAHCHGAAGQGGTTSGTMPGETMIAPPLVAQYPAYLRKQLDDFASASRTHAHSQTCGAPEPALRDAILNQLVELGR